MAEKTRKFLIATHGALAQGIKSSLDIIVGAVENVFIIQAYLDENKPIEEELDQLARQSDPEDEWMIFTDLLGGSITNQILRHSLGQRAQIVAGFNLPLLLEVLMADTETPLAEILETAIAQAREQLVHVNKLLTANHNESAND